MRSARFIFTVICEPRILPLRTGLRYHAVTCLHAQTCRQDKLANGSAESTQEGIEGLGVAHVSCGVQLKARSDATVRNC